MRGTLIALSALVAATGSCSSSQNETRVPANHRLAGSACPQDRGGGVSAVSTFCSQSSPLVGICTGDDTCTTGTNGRCLQGPGPACNYGCTYDECYGDSDCAGNIPCACRSSASDSAANTCATASNCRVDTDCGPGGFCSPSLVGSICDCISEAFCTPGEASCSETDTNGVTVQVPCLCSGNCGRGYFCHTAKDGCIDDSDCTDGRTCTYDLTSQSWMCAGCVIPP